MSDIPIGTKVSFIDPISLKPVKGVVKLDLKNFIGVEYTGKNEPSAPGKHMHRLVDKDGNFSAWANISKEKVFIIR